MKYISFNWKIRDLTIILIVRKLAISKINEIKIIEKFFVQVICILLCGIFFFIVLFCYWGRKMVDFVYEFLYFAYFSYILSILFSKQSCSNTHLTFIDSDIVSTYDPSALIVCENGKCQRSVTLLCMETSRDNPRDVVTQEEIEFQDLFVIYRWVDKVYYLCAL